MLYVYVVCVLSVDLSLKRTLYSILPSPLKLGYALNILSGVKVSCKAGQLSLPDPGLDRHLYYLP